MATDGELMAASLLRIGMKSSRTQRARLVKHEATPRDPRYKVTKPEVTLSWTLTPSHIMQHRRLNANTTKLESWRYPPYHNISCKVRESENISCKDPLQNLQPPFYKPRPPVFQVVSAISPEHQTELPSDTNRSSPLSFPRCFRNSGEQRPAGCQMSTGTSCRSLGLSCYSSCVSSDLAFLQDRPTLLSSPVRIWGQAGYLGREGLEGGNLPLLDLRLFLTCRYERTWWWWLIGRIINVREKTDTAMFRKSQMSSEGQSWQLGGKVS